VATIAEMWPARQDGDRPSGRLVAAFVVSIACHASVLMLARGWRVESLPLRPLVVTMVERGRGDDGEGGAGAAAAALAPVPAAFAAPAVTKVALPHASQRRRAPSGRETAAPLAAASGGSGTLGAGSGGSALGSGAGNGSGSDGLRAFCLNCPTPDYPVRARRQGWQGTVDVELAIGGDGAVQEARVGRSSGYPALDEVALGVARQSCFAMSAGGAGLRGQLRYRFVLDETAARRSSP
jgi:TonB family protein